MTILADGTVVGALVVEEAKADTLLAEAQALTGQSEVTPEPVSEPKPPVNLPGGPKAEPKTNASAIDRMAQLFGAEYDFGKASQFALQKAVVELVGQIRGSEKKHIYPKMAGIVAAIAELIRRFKVSYTTIGGLIQEGSLEKPKVSVVLNHPESKMPAEVEKESKTTPDRQYATRYVRLARWTNARTTGGWPKGDKPVQTVTIMGKDYPTPVDALLDGFSLNQVEMAWAKAVGRLHRQDMRDKPRADEITAEYAETLVKGISIPIRVNDENVTDANGKVIAQKRSNIKVVGHIAATLGTVVGLLKGLPTASLSMDDASTIIELAEGLAATPPETPSEVPTAEAPATT